MPQEKLSHGQNVTDKMSQETSELEVDPPLVERVGE